jgi:hypothetical protein
MRRVTNGHTGRHVRNATTKFRSVCSWCVPRCAACYRRLDGFLGLVVRMLASGSRVRGFKPGRSRWIFLYIKILSMPSFGGKVK